MCTLTWSLFLFFSLIFCAYPIDAFGTFSIDTQNRCFLKDGKPWQYISGSLHYFRIHPDQWEDRLMRVRAMGLNAIQVYSAWVLHEPTPGNFDFSSPRLDIARFLGLAQKYNLSVLFRPGPYICTEFDFGALPWWLLNMDGIQLRTYETNYINAVTNYFNALLDVIKPFTYKNGGPIIMVQVENEYGVLQACNYTYTAYVKNLIWAKLGNDTVTYNTDQTNEHAQTCGGFGDGLATVDFGPSYKGQIDYYFNLQQEHVNITPGLGGGPKVVSEFWVTGTPYWTQPQPFTYNIGQIVSNIEYMHSINASVNIYMTHAGTNFGFTSGGYVNWEGGNGKVVFGGGQHFDQCFGEPIATNYGMCSPIAQNGEITPLFTAIRSLIQNLSNWENPPTEIPANNPVSSYGQVTLTPIGTSLIAALTRIQEQCVSSTDPLTFEKLNYGFGYVLYTNVLKSSGKNLNVPNIKDFGYVFVNNNYKGMVGWNGVRSLQINGNPGDVLRILVENGGREHYWDAYLPALEFRGLFDVTLDSKTLSDWVQCATNLTEDSINALSNNQIDSAIPQKASTQPGIYIGTFNADPIQDTFFDSSGWGKGQIFINGFNLGRYWPIAGPELTLYVPKPILKPKNTVVLIELVGGQQNFINFTDTPKYYWKGYSVDKWGCIWQ